jgi:hypothetical protein
MDAFCQAFTEPNLPRLPKTHPVALLNSTSIMRDLPNFVCIRCNQGNDRGAEMMALVIKGKIKTNAEVQRAYRERHKEELKASRQVQNALIHLRSRSGLIGTGCHLSSVAYFSS